MKVELIPAAPGADELNEAEVQQLVEILQYNVTIPQMLGDIGGLAGQRHRVETDARSFMDDLRDKLKGA